MRPTRRALLQAGAGALVAGWRPGRAADRRNLLVCLTGIGPEMSQAALAAAVQPFLDRAVPVCLALDLSAGAEAEVHRAAAALAAREPGLVEVAVVLGDAGETGRYFRMRRAAGLRAQVRGLLRASALPAVALPVVTVLAEGAQDQLDFPAFRSAGFLGLVALDPGRRATAVGPLGFNQVGISGGVRLSAGDPGLLAALEAGLRRPGEALIALDLGGAAPSGAGLGALAGRLRAEIDRGAVYAARPLDLVLQLSLQAPACIALALAAPSSAAEAEALAALGRELDGAGIAHSVLRDGAATATAAAAAPVCDILRAPRAPGAQAAPAAACVWPVPMSALTAADPARVVIGGAGPAGWSELDAEARLVIPPAETPAEWGLDPALPPSAVDRLIVLPATAAATPVARIALARSLSALRDEGQAAFYSVQGFADHVLSPDPLRDRLHAARARRHRDPPAPAPLDEAERAALLEDARIAWRYIERLTHEETGLCAGAAQESGTSLFATRQATLWDLASQIQGIVAAQALGLVGRADAGIRIVKLLAGLPDQQVEGLRLPPLFLATDRRAVVTPGYDFCDTGRFLLALSSAVTAGLLDAERARAVFAGWDLAATIREGRPFEYLRGRWRDVFFNHCTPFLSRALAPWGLTIASPYPDPPETGAGDGDYRMRVLYSAANIGPYGAEPPLLEEAELGPTPATQLLAEVLFDAQLSHFEATGKLKCVSETSLNAAPWFAYQGFRLDAPAGEGWVIVSPNSAAAYATDAFRARVEAVSAKAAYLWAAHYPHAHSRRMVEFVRAKARMPTLGFSVGIFAQTGEAMPGYSDINTNGIILGAIAHMLRAPG